ncbi:cyclodeaminase/cyclohydrolase family protein [Microlunatus ginsengisoli]|uniref:Cyclodeaminase/cyclohydrolase family protein n=1 Tax=Microlunatus ginsengisoli TaxID=363863 RepID=A0ABP7AXA4_9ACTN
MIASQSVDRYLDRLASGDPTPGGGAAAALHAAQGAALVAMVARFTTGARFADRHDQVAEITAAADDLRARAIQLADADEAAFQTVISAYRLPKASPEEKASRSSAIQEALATAAGPPQDLVVIAAAVVALGDRLAGIANPNVISDVAAAAEAARAAATTARVNIEINLAGLTDPERTAPLRQSVNDAGTVVDTADALAATVRRQINR